MKNLILIILIINNLNTKYFGRSEMNFMCGKAESKLKRFNKKL